MAQPTFVLYRLRNIGDHLLYVGITSDWTSRMRQHAKCQPWWSEVASTELVSMHCTRSQAEAVERSVIVAERPAYNISHNVAPVLPPPSVVETTLRYAETLIETAGLSGFIPYAHATSVGRYSCSMPGQVTAEQRATLQRLLAAASALAVGDPDRIVFCLRQDRHNCELTVRDVLNGQPVCSGSESA